MKNTDLNIINGILDEIAAQDKDATFLFMSESDGQLFLNSGGSIEKATEMFVATLKGEPNLRAIILDAFDQYRKSN